MALEYVLNRSNEYTYLFGVQTAAILTFFFGCEWMGIEGWLQIVNEEGHPVKFNLGGWNRIESLDFSCAQ